MLTDPLFSLGRRPVLTLAVFKFPILLSNMIFPSPSDQERICFLLVESVLFPVPNVAGEGLGVIRRQVEIIRRLMSKLTVFPPKEDR
jgi:hypothetical protein